MLWNRMDSVAQKKALGSFCELIRTRSDSLCVLFAQIDLTIRIELVAWLGMEMTRPSRAKGMSGGGGRRGRREESFPQISGEHRALHNFGEVLNSSCCKEFHRITGNIGWFASGRWRKRQNPGLTVHIQLTFWNFCLTVFFCRSHTGWLWYFLTISPPWLWGSPKTRIFENCDTKAQMACFHKPFNCLQLLLFGFQSSTSCNNK